MRTTALALAVVTTFAATAHAQGKADADTLFHEARALIQQGDFAHACPKFAESEKLDPAPGTLLNLAECEEQLGHLVEAQEHYRLAVSGFPKKDVRRDIGTARSAAIDARLAHLTVRLAPGAPEGTAVRKGDVTIAPGDFGQAIATNPGALSIVVTAPDHADKTYPLNLKEGEAVDLTVQAGDVTPPRQAVAEEKVVVVEKPMTTASPLRPIGIAALAVGVVGIGVGVVTGIMTIDAANTVKTHCNTTTNICADQTGYSAAQNGQVLAPLSTVAVIAGAVLAVTGIVLFAVGGHSAKAHVSVGLGSVAFEGAF